MCLCIYIGSPHELPLVPWAKSDPGFHVDLLDPEDGTYATIMERLNTTHIYQLGGYMGCACPLFYSPRYESDLSERIHDVRAMLEYLMLQLSEGPLKLFATSWDEFPEVYPQRSFTLMQPVDGSFEFPENEVLELER